MSMNQLTQKESEARDLAVRRALELLVAHPTSPFLSPPAPGPQKTLEERVAALRYAIHPADFRDGRWGLLTEYGTKRSIAALEALLAEPWEDTPENLCLRALTLEEIGLGRYHLKDVSGCLAALRQAGELAAGAGPVLELRRCLMLQTLSNILAECGETDESTAMAMQAAELATDVHPHEMPERCYILRQISEALSENGALEEALDVATKAVEIAERFLEPQATLLGDALLQLAEVHHRRGELDAAEAAALSARIVWADQSLVWEEEAACMHKLASIREALGDMAGCIVFRREAVAFWRAQEHTYGKDSPHQMWELAMSLGNLGTALARDRQWREAAAALEEALGLFASLSRFGKEYPEAREIAAKLEECRRALGKGSAVRKAAMERETGPAPDISPSPGAET